jgi:hypothetical protein
LDLTLACGITVNRVANFKSAPLEVSSPAFAVRSSILITLAASAASSAAYRLGQNRKGAEE